MQKIEAGVHNTESDARFLYFSPLFLKLFIYIVTYKIMSCIPLQKT